MASTYTSRLRLVKPTTGELNNTWGNVFNQQFSDLIDQAIAGWLEVVMADADVTLTNTNGVADQSRYMMLSFTGANTAAKTVTVPTTSKLYFVENATSGGYGLEFTTATGSGVTVPNGAKALLACDGTDVVSIINHLPASSTVGDYEIGYKGIPQNSKSADYTLVLTDAGKHIYHPAADATARTWTIPANSSVAFSVGTTVTFVNDEGAGSVIIAIGSPDVLVLSGIGSSGTRTLAATGVATALKVDSTRWIISGTGIT